MSVEVKTPTRTPFEHCDFHCQTGGSNRPASMEHFACADDNRPGTSSDNTLLLKDKSPLFGRRCSLLDTSEDESLGKNRRPSLARKRRNSEKTQAANSCPVPFKRRPSGRRSIDKEKIVLPTKFLLGGSITDPLNLNSMCDEEINRALNERTPQSSPLPVPAHKEEVKVMIPPNINDPLNLNSGEDVKLELLSPRNSNNKKKKNKGKKRKSLDLSGSNETDPTETSTPVELSNNCTQPISIEIAEELEESVPVRDTTESKIARIIDKIVSPVVPQKSPKGRRRKRNSSECKTEVSNASVTKSQEEQLQEKSLPTLKHGQQTLPKQKKSQKKDSFIYGNYNRYYGYRNPETDDPRLRCIKNEWVEGKDVLDIGCNVGHLTLSVAKYMQPKKIVGVDIDRQLIVSAKKNIRHYLAKSTLNIDKYPSSLPLTYGPLSAPAVTSEKACGSFPNNVMFMQGNYVPENNEQVQMQQEEYDVIICFSITKWFHLHFGDQGLKRAFQRMYRQLRPGGRLILEPQAWASYKRKKNLTKAIHATYQTLKFRPENFTEYLLSSSVGFSMCQQLEAPLNKSKGFQRPIMVYTKPETANPTPYRQDSKAVTPCPSSSIGTTPVQSETPFNSYEYGTPQSQNSTPKFAIGSSLTPSSSHANSPYGPGFSCASPWSDSKPSPDQRESVSPETTPEDPVVDSKQSVIELPVSTERDFATCDKQTEDSVVSSGEPAVNST